MLNQPLRQGWRSFHVQSEREFSLEMEKFITKTIIIFWTFMVVSVHAQARVVSHLEVKGIGLYSDQRNDKDEERACKVFRPTKKQMTRYFNLSKESEESGNLLHEYYSPCLAIGSVKFKDGTSGRWTVQSSGLGIVVFENGKSSVFFHKDNQWTDPYACTYGLRNDPIC